jgi:hypothetical protein
VTWNLITQCGIGLLVDGASNDLRGGDITNSTNDGVRLGATATGNKLQGATITGNGGNGINVLGNTNTVASNKANLNGLNGVTVSGNGNTVKGNQAGTGAGQGNAHDGFKVTGSATKLNDNSASANEGDGFDVSGGAAGVANVLKGNQSNLGVPNGNRENAQFEYRLLNTVKSGGGNKADGIGVPKGSAPPKCVGFPGSGVTTTFAAEFGCE